MTGLTPTSDRATTSGPAARAGHRTRVFLLDDHELIRRGLHDVLEADPEIEVVGESGSAAEAARRIPALRPDVALLDVRLPDGSGIEVCRTVRARDDHVRALMVTSFDDEEARTAAALAGASGFILKQIRGSELVDAVHRVAAGETVAPGLEEGIRPRPERARMEELAVSSLTPRERRVLDLVVEGLTNAQIGEHLAISEKTVRNHVTNVLAKLGFTRRTQAAVFMARREG
ncbi:response regulator transcription factor [Phycicoccus sp.]|uniref:response regulator transcription factor n=1 Tax=Phycicoccus sp. TaxID=1902410 RepID=UPI002C703CF7|nr:response regulator transcription factor [Phycicoccus sp.]HMM94945.1 response regulator transcription factor [Phycicoccus sp.]